MPDLESLEFDPRTKTIRREGVVNLVNTFEKHALSAAKELVEASGGGEITVITMGPPQAKEALLELLASGADRAVHLNDRAFAGSDTLATSRVLAKALTRGQYDLIFCGKYSLDAETGQVGPEIAELLGLPQVTNAVKVTDYADGRLAVTRMTDEGSEELLVQLPALLTVPEDIAHPARPNRAGREAAASKPYEVISAADLGLAPELLGVTGSPTSVREISTIDVGRQVRQIPAGNLPAAAQELAGVLVDLGVFGQWKGSGGEAAQVPDSRPPRSDRAVWVVAELYAGRVRPVTYELLGEAITLAGELGSEVCAVVLGPEAASLAPELGAHGADRVLLATSAELAHYDTRRYAHVLAEAIRARQPYAVLLPSTVNGRDLAPRVAAQLGLGLTGDCIGFELDAEQRLVQLKPAFGGNIVAPILSSTRPQMATVRPGVLQALRPNPRRQPRVDALDLAGLPEAGTEWVSAAPTVG
ncbi:MAG: FAD-binding protein, partial [Chloroflexota bacterium]